MTLSEPYLYNTQAMVMKADREDEIMQSVDGLTVTAEKGSTGEGKLQGTIADDDTVEVSAQEYFANANYVASDSMAKALMEVKAGTADVALVDSVAAYGMVGHLTLIIPIWSSMWIITLVFRNMSSDSVKEAIWKSM